MRPGIPLQSAALDHDNFVMDGVQPEPRAQVLEFPRPVPGDVAAPAVPSRLATLAAKVDAARPGPVEGRVPDRIAAGVLGAGVVLCWIGSAVTPPIAVAESNVLWISELISTVFWGAAFMAVVGLLYRVRRGLFAALVASVAFLSAPVVAVFLDPDVVGRMWFGELICAVEFVCVCLAALWSTRDRASGAGVANSNNYDAS